MRLRVAFDWLFLTASWINKITFARKLLAIHSIAVFTRPLLSQASTQRTGPSRKIWALPGKVSHDGGAVSWHAILAINNISDYLRTKILHILLWPRISFFNLYLIFENWPKFFAEDGFVFYFFVFLIMFEICWALFEYFWVPFKQLKHLATNLRSYSMACPIHDQSCNYFVSLILVDLKNKRMKWLVKFSNCLLGTVSFEPCWTANLSHLILLC